MCDTCACGTDENVDDQLFWKYDIRKSVYWILFNSYKKVCLQFPDSILKDAYDIARLIEQKIDRKVYIMGDTTYGSCCVDDVNAKHINADAIIHYGRACLTSREDTPTLYVFPKTEIDVKLFCCTLIKFSAQVTSEIILLYDVSYSYVIEKIVHNLAILRSKVRVSRLDTRQQNNEGLKWSSRDVLISKFGRVYSIPHTANENELTYVYILDGKFRKNFLNFMFIHQSAAFYRYECHNEDRIQLCSAPQVLKRRMFLVEKVKEASRIGILLCTLSSARYLEAAERIKELCRLRKKRPYLVSVGKINVAKLANLAEIPVFVLIGCPEMDIPNEDFYQTIVTVTEAELALHNNESSWQTNISDYREFLSGGRMYKEIHKNTEDFPETEVSLLNGGNTIVNNVVNSEIFDVTGKALALKNPMVVSQTDINEGLTGRSWKGLQLKIDDTPVVKAMTGLTGTPNGGYQYPSFSELT